MREAPLGAPPIAPAMEAIEGRLLLSAAAPATAPPLDGFDASVQNGILVVRGTSGDDSIGIDVATVGSSHTVVYEVGWAPLNSIVPIAIQHNIPAAGVRAIEVHLGTGDDDFSAAQSPVGDAQPVTVPVTVYAGSGNDTVTGGAGPNVLYGKAGNDSLIGGPGPDQLFGGPGNDTLRGGPGNDTLTAGLGNNELFGGAGNDLFFAANSQADTLFGGPGNDTAHTDVGLDQIPNNDVESILQG